MKNLKIVCFIMGLVSIVKFILPFIIVKAEPHNHVGHSIFFLILNFGIIIIAVLVSVILAMKLNRSGLGWGIFSLFLPFISCFILPFLDEKEYSYSGSSSYGGSSYGSTYMSSKSCSACGKSVSYSSAAGQRCPHCGVYWSTERKITR